MIAAVAAGILLPICLYFAGFVLPFDVIDDRGSKDGRSLSFGDRYANGFLLSSALMSLSVIICKMTGCSLDRTLRALILEFGVLMSLGIMSFYRIIRHSGGTLRPEAKLLPQEIAVCALGFILIVISTALCSEKLLSKDVLRSLTDLYKNTIAGTDPETGREAATYSAVSLFPGYHVLTDLICSVTGADPSIICRYAFAPASVFGGLVVSRRIFCRFFDNDRKKTATAMLFLIPVMFFAVSPYSPGYISFFGAGTGDGMYAAVFVPAVIYTAVLLYDEASGAVTWIRLILAGMAGCFFGMTGIVVTPFLIFFFCLCPLIARREWKRVPLLLAVSVIPAAILIAAYFIGTGRLTIAL